MVTRVRTALFLDFDNVFGGLHKIDPEAALEFAERPGVWLRALEESLTVSGPRRWLVLRCYMNPAGWLPAASGDAGRLYFSRFRPAFTRAGFEVIDCPRLSTTKNAADIRLVLDAVDATFVVPAYEEFVIASGDSDMTPLLVRLRAADRRTTILSPSDAAEAFTAVADRLIGADQVLGLVQGEPTDDDDDLDQDAARATEPDGNLGVTSALGQARDLVTDRYQRADAPLNLARLASEIQSEVAESSPPGILRATRWFGAGTFGQFLKRMDLPGLELSQHYLWDASRHTPPHEEVVDEEALPSAVDRLTVTLSLPRPPRTAWAAMYVALAEYAATHEFKLAEAIRRVRDQLAEEEIPVSRQMVGVVTRATAFGGAPLHAEPSPTAEQIAEAVVHNMLGRAGAAGMILSDDEVAVVRSWFGGTT